MSDKRSESTIPLMYNLKGLIEASCKNCGERIAVEFTSLYPLEPSKEHPEGMEGYDNKQVPVICSKCGKHQNIHYYINVGVVTDIPTYEQEPRNVNVNIEGPIVSDKQMDRVIDAYKESGTFMALAEEEWTKERKEKGLLDKLLESAESTFAAKNNSVAPIPKDAFDHLTDLGKDLVLNVRPKRNPEKIEVEVDFSVSKPQPTPIKRFKTQRDLIKHDIIEHVADAFIEILEHFNLHQHEPVEHIEISIALSSAIEKLVAVKKSLEQ